MFEISWSDLMLQMSWPVCTNMFDLLFRGSFSPSEICPLQNVVDFKLLPDKESC